MGARTAPDLALSIPHCTFNGTIDQTNGTCLLQVDHFSQAFSSTVVLVVLVAVIVGIILVSLTTFHFHKSKMKKRKIQRAQEEYERDNCSPTTAKGRPADRQCIMVRPGHRDGDHRPPTGEQKCERKLGSQSDPPMAVDDSNKADTRHTGQGHEQLLETVILS
ncbi:uncharacterized protein C11orf87 homolog [Amia ocellicauda]|uniref:uncharacterized protein C11orf87 homolog n=1 Tax=Amia ocellicauda TaxID=2972642 RepID=UPI0034643868